MQQDCSHCYINATDQKMDNELTTQESQKPMIKSARSSGRSLFSAVGELFAFDIFELIEYGSAKGLNGA
jgi:MoaA/NifB/PqqE/SkfB family radical SAM enzyme